MTYMTTTNEIGTLPRTLLRSSSECWTGSQVYALMWLVYSIPNLGLHIMRLARTRSLRANLTRKRNSLCAMPSDLRRYISHMLCPTNGKHCGVGGGTRSTLKEYLANAMFFLQLLCVPKNRTTIVHRYVLTYIL